MARTAMARAAHQHGLERNELNITVAALEGAKARLEAQQTKALHEMALLDYHFENVGQIVELVHTLRAKIDRIRHLHRLEIHDLRTRHDAETKELTDDVEHLKQHRLDIELRLQSVRDAVGLEFGDPSEMRITGEYSASPQSLRRIRNVKSEPNDESEPVPLLTPKEEPECVTLDEYGEEVERRRRFNRFRNHDDDSDNEGPEGMSRIEGADAMAVN